MGVCVWRPISPHFSLILSYTWRGKDVKGCGPVCWGSGHHSLPLTSGKKPQARYRQLRKTRVVTGQYPSIPCSDSSGLRALWTTVMFRVMLTWYERDEDEVKLTV